MSQMPAMKIRSSRGFTAIELIIVLVIISVLSIMAVPSYLQWRQSLEARETARDYVNILRLAKSAAINTNLEQDVQFDAALRRYGSCTGNQAYNATMGPVTNWVTIKSEVTSTPTVTIQFYPNGTSKNSFLATSASITVQNITGTRTFTVSVTNTGNIRMQ